MLLVGFEITIAWAAMVGTAYLARIGLRLGRMWSLMSVGACYSVLAFATLATMGFDERGVLAAAGLIVPAIVASALVMLSPATGA